MPYIKEEGRKRLETPLFYVKGSDFESPGDLNYFISMVCQKYLKEKGYRYTTLNEIVGALECTKIELYRRLAVPYEQQKIEENGDVYNV